MSLINRNGGTSNIAALLQNIEPHTAESEADRNEEEYESDRFVMLMY